MCASAGTVSPVDYGTSKSTSISPVRRTPASVGARRYRLSVSVRADHVSVASDGNDCASAGTVSPVDYGTD
ncbi:hypothetical protein BaRGS_00037129 [Batillaria attramentaria]|uniref:Uncharacterized protein n=1 Tax=Batillaria attramentaria TaxID=370345 RepID=A0ABD0JAR4_9CAEN